MTILFISDLHLNTQQPDITAGFLNFLTTQAATAKALYILGDLFAYWIGDDDPNPLHDVIANAIRRQVDAGLVVYFMCGNRDILLGKAFAQGAGMILLPHETVVPIGSTRYVLVHGDQLCTLDRPYQYFRYLSHTPWLRQLFLTLPLAWRLKAIRRLRHQSQQKRHHTTQRPARYDVTTEAVQALCQRHQVSHLIHGHTHQGRIYQQANDGITRIVLKDWENSGSVLYVTATGYELTEFPLHQITSIKT